MNNTPPPVLSHTLVTPQSLPWQCIRWVWLIHDNDTVDTGWVKESSVLLNDTSVESLKVVNISVNLKKISSYNCGNHKLDGGCCMRKKPLSKLFWNCQIWNKKIILLSPQATLALDFAYLNVDDRNASVLALDCICLPPFLVSSCCSNLSICVFVRTVNK
jgi:hypothetical protein